MVHRQIFVTNKERCLQLPTHNNLFCSTQFFCYYNVNVLVYHGDLFTMSCSGDTHGHVESHQVTQQGKAVHVRTSSHTNMQGPHGIKDM